MKLKQRTISVGESPIEDRVLEMSTTAADWLTEQPAFTYAVGGDGDGGYKVRLVKAEVARPSRQMIVGRLRRDNKLAVEVLLQAQTVLTNQQHALPAKAAEDLDRHPIDVEFPNKKLTMTFKDFAGNIIERIDETMIESSTLH